MFEVPGSDVVEVIVTPEAVRGTKSVEYVHGQQRNNTDEEDTVPDVHFNTQDVRSART